MLGHEVGGTNCGPYHANSAGKAPRTKLGQLEIRLDIHNLETHPGRFNLNNVTLRIHSAANAKYKRMVTKSY